MGSSIGDRLSSMGMGGSGGGSGIGRTIRNIMIAIGVLVLALVLVPSTVTYINPGYVGIVIHRAGGYPGLFACSSRIANSTADARAAQSHPIPNRSGSTRYAAAVPRVEANSKSPRLST